MRNLTCYDTLERTAVLQEFLEFSQKNGSRFLATDDGHEWLHWMYIKKCVFAQNMQIWKTRSTSTT